MKFSTVFLRDLTNLVVDLFGTEADIIFRFVSEKRIKREIELNQETKGSILYKSQYILIIYTHVDEDIFCFIDKKKYNNRMSHF